MKPRRTSQLQATKHRWRLTVLVLCVGLLIAATSEGQASPEETLYQALEAIRERPGNVQRGVDASRWISSASAAMPPEQLLMSLHALRSLFESETTDPLLRAHALDAFGTVLARGKARALVGSADIQEYESRILEISGDGAAPPDLRAMAMKNAQELDLKGAAETAAAWARSPSRDNNPLLTRHSLLTLLALGSPEAEEIASQIARSTRVESIYGTACFILGELPSGRAMLVTIEAMDRFPGNPSCEDALNKLAPQLLDALESSWVSPMPSTIRACSRIWAPTFWETAETRLLALMSKGSPEIESAAIEALLSRAGTLPFETEKILLAKVLGEARDREELLAYVPRIESRLRATFLDSSSSDIPTPPRAKNP